MAHDDDLVHGTGHHAIPRSRRSSSSRSRILACTVTSKAVVGSSANNTLGSHINPIAMTTR
ncbi:hypothetical protein B005_4150 [Nocardiopsis alba ATCC BAA-2165]|uniref:Uncharacterized protein n=1 Tax=Nocardiopsis alba (strain ATCC BAA-2165 / BE74) TaxID=1205910 RepID=J7KYW1_NOCAA|nr:hypothetical protein B005_4150 [Nocardiopsis alba ATCC BAA-2165]